jgi:hypothetical protein
VEGKGIIKDNVNDTYGQRERDVNDPVVAVCLQRGSIGTLGQRFKPKNDRGQRRRQSPFFENRREATRGLPVQAQYERGNTKDARSSREVEHGSIHRGDWFVSTSVKTRSGCSKRIRSIRLRQMEAEILQQFVANIDDVERKCVTAENLPLE